MIETLPLIVAAVSILGGAGLYAYQKRIDRRTALIEARRTAYLHYLNSFFAMSDSPQSIQEVRRNYYQSEAELLVIGSDNVIQRVGALSRFYSETNADRHRRDAARVRQLVAEVCSVMRADCFEKTRLSTEEIQQLVPIA